MSAAVSLENLKKDLQAVADKRQAALLQRFFKTGPGEYAEGDVFLGIKVPVQRSILKKYLALDLEDIQELLNSKIHEHRFTGLLILVRQYEKGDISLRKKIYDFYLANTRNINNWDLVDVTCPRIVGQYLLEREKRFFIH